MNEEYLARYKLLKEIIDKKSFDKDIFREKNKTERRKDLFDQIKADVKYSKPGRL